MRLFNEPLPAKLLWDEGELVALVVAGHRHTVVEQMRKWRVEADWWKDGVARDYLTLKPCKPDFNLIEPARIGRSVMNPNGRIGVEELENAFGFMCAQVVGHDVNLFPRRLTGDDLAQKVDKFDAGMPSRRLTDDVAGASIQRCIQ